MPETCAHCGKPVEALATTPAPHRVYHGDCYRLAFPPAHPEQWAKPIGSYSHDEQVRDGILFP